MIIILALVVLIAAVVVGVAAVLGNRGIGHALVHPFSVLGYHVTGSEGRLFLYGIVVGALGLLGLSLLLAGARRTSRRGSAARRGLRQSRQETAAVSQDRDDLIDQRDTTARAHPARAPRAAATHTPHQIPSQAQTTAAGAGCTGSGRRLAPVPAAAGSPERLNGQVVPDAPTDIPAP